MHFITTYCTTPSPLAAHRSPLTAHPTDPVVAYFGDSLKFMSSIDRYRGSEAMMALSTFISVIKPIICGMAAALSWVEIVSKNSSFMMEVRCRGVNQGGERRGCMGWSLVGWDSGDGWGWRGWQTWVRRGLQVRLTLTVTLIILRLISCCIVKFYNFYHYMPYCTRSGEGDAGEQYAGRI